MKRKLFGWANLALAIFVPFFYSAQLKAADGDAVFGVSPDSAYSVLKSAIGEAQDSISLNVYMLTNKAIAQALAKEAAEGTKVTVLVEGEPHGGKIFPAMKNALDFLQNEFEKSAPKNGRILVMTGKKFQGKRRFVFNHAKYMVIDGKKVFASSENFTGSAFANHHYVGGSRGWLVLLENKDLASEVLQIFRADTSGKGGDVVPYREAELEVEELPDQNLPPKEERKRRSVTEFKQMNGTIKEAALCLSPKSLPCMLDFIRSAQRELSVQHLSLPYRWLSPNQGKNVRMNPIVEELVAAARRGVKVRVLLNDDRSFDNDPPGPEEIRNSFTVDRLNEMAKSENLPMEAALFNSSAVELSYVHNKGMIADGKRVFVSSINGTENSVTSNRELAVALETEDGARFFGDVFGFDWDKSAR